MGAFKFITIPQSGTSFRGLNIVRRKMLALWFNCPLQGFLYVTLTQLSLAVVSDRKVDLRDHWSELVCRFLGVCDCACKSHEKLVNWAFNGMQNDYLLMQLLWLSAPSWCTFLYWIGPWFLDHKCRSVATSGWNSKQLNVAAHDGKINEQSWTFWMFEKYNFSFYSLLSFFDSRR